MEYLFVLGKNPLLSIAEILSYFESRQIEFKIKEAASQIIILETKNDLNTQETMFDLGGTIKICQVLQTLNKENIEIEFEKIFSQTQDKLRFGVSVYPKSSQSKKIWIEITEKIKQYCKDNRIKIIHIKSSKKHGLIQLKHFEVLKKLIKKDGCEIVVFVDDSKIFLSKTLAVHDPSEFKIRDVGRPKQRAIYSIPPRLAKILINLSGAVQNDLLLDPFCGIGTILQEAMLMKINTIGVDRSEKCIRNAEMNLNWIKEKYEIKDKVKNKLIVGDSREISNYFDKNSIDAVATEPYLGPPLKRNPTKAQAEKILRELEDLYTKSLKEINKVLKPGKKVSMVFPNFKTEEGTEMGLNVHDISEKSGFRIKNPLENTSFINIYKNYSIIDADERHKTRREIFVLEKI